LYRVILHVDLNNFYASVECLHRPELRDKPVAVGGDPTLRHGIILAKNYPAKSYGIKTGEVIWQARKKCPDLIVVPPNYSLYLRFARLAREIYSSYTDQIEPFGIDEAWLDVTKSRSLYGDGKKIADEIRARIKFELGITASVGVSYNKIFAKLGSDMKKPDATTVITPNNFRQVVWPLPAADLLYVGRATEKKLSRYMIRTIGDIAVTSRYFLRFLLGKWGDILWSFANGEDNSPVAVFGEEGFIKSIGNSTTTPRDLVDNEDVKMVIYVLAESVAARLREHGFKCRTVQIHVRDCDLNVFTRQGKVGRPTNLSSEIAPLAMELFTVNYHWEKPLRSIGVRGTDLVTEREALQVSLFMDEEKRKRHEDLEKTVDILRKRFGHFSIQRGMMLEDRKLTGLNPKDDHVIHPVNFWGQK
jgi:DNA polymerase-4